jgi:hypothetical protein
MLETAVGDGEQELRLEQEVAEAGRLNADVRAAAAGGKASEGTTVVSGVDQRDVEEGAGACRSSADARQSDVDE